MGIVAIGVVASVLHDGPVVLAQSVPDYFAFRFEHGMYTAKTHDSAEAVVIHDTGPREVPRSIPFVLSAGTHDAVYA